MNYLEMLPVSSIAKFAKGHPGDGVPFTGYPRANPSEKDKLILVNDPLGPEPVVLEFKLDDILFVEEVPSAVTKTGEGVPLVKLWIKRGAAGMIIEPFEVNEINNPSKLANRVQAIKERVLQTAPQTSAPQAAPQASPQAALCVLTVLRCLLPKQAKTLYAIFVLTPAIFKAGASARAE